METDYTDRVMNAHQTWQRGSFGLDRAAEALHVRPSPLGIAICVATTPDYAAWIAKRLNLAATLEAAKAEAPVDFRKILMAYIAHVGDMEGIDFLPSDLAALTPREIGELHKAAAEAAVADHTSDSHIDKLRAAARRHGVV